MFSLSNPTLEHNNQNKVGLWIDIFVIKVLNSTVSRSRLGIARPEVTFFEMCSTCAVQVRDSSIIRPSDFVISTLLISNYLR